MVSLCVFLNGSSSFPVLHPPSPRFDAPDELQGSVTLFLFNLKCSPCIIFPGLPVPSQHPAMPPSPPPSRNVQGQGTVLDGSPSLCSSFMLCFPL